MDVDTIKMLIRDEILANLLVEGEAKDDVVHISLKYGGELITTYSFWVGA